MYAYAHATLDNETTKLTGFSSSDKFFDFFRRFYCPEGLPNLFTQQMSLFFKDSIHQVSALVFTDNIPLMTKLKPHMLQLVKQLFDIATDGNLKLAREKFSCFWL